MNITKTLWVAAICTLATLAGCTNGQGPNNIAGIQRIENKTAFALVVAQGTEMHQLAPATSIDLEINSANITIMRVNSVGTIDRIVMRYNPGRCAVAHCLELN
ncbi:hypothetical protein [Pseudomonas sp. 8 R 14]|nr:hypothetical protein [Pseudomonas sp. 8 R 14]SAM31882.1 hypothetical protein BN1864_LIB5394:01929 [Pseudomonas sp. 1 R 17]